MFFMFLFLISLFFYESRLGVFFLGVTLISVPGVIKEKSAACCSERLGRNCESPGSVKTEEGSRGASLPLPWTSSMISTSLPESSSSPSSTSSSELELESSSLSFKLTTAAATYKRNRQMCEYVSQKRLRNIDIVHEIFLTVGVWVSLLRRSDRRSRENWRSFSNNWLLFFTLSL